MNIIGPDSLCFGVVDLDASVKYLEDYGLRRVESGHHGATLEALDGISCRPSTLSHLVLFTTDVQRAERFYAERLGFRTVDYFIGAGPFMRPAGTYEHHTLFLIQSSNLGLQHFTFHLSGPNELMKAGFEFCRKGYRSVWGPGRHILGSNYFWYFASPFGGLMEFDADMDLHDDRWVPRRVPLNADTSQTFLFDYREKWSPGGNTRPASSRQTMECLP